MNAREKKKKANKSLNETKQKSHYFHDYKHYSTSFKIYDCCYHYCYDV